MDCTTNPSLVLKAVQNPQYHHYLKKAMASEPDPSDSQNSDRSHILHGPASYAAISITAKLNICCLLARPWAGVTDHLAVNIGTELLGIVPGRVSTEVDAHLSYDTQATIDKARLIDTVAIVADVVQS